MATSYRAFQIELYEEYLTNGAFLSDQRRALLAQPCGKWGLLRDWEERIEAQVDALIVGGNLALQVCQRRALEGEPGEFEIAVRVFLRQSKLDLLEQAISDAQAWKGPKSSAIAEGFLHERHPDLSPLVQRLLKSHQELLPSLARVIGQQRLPLGTLLLDSNSRHPAVIRALGRLRDQRAIPLLNELLGSVQNELQITTALALLRVTHNLRASQWWPLFIHGLMGQRQHVGSLLNDGSADSSLALGLIGDTAAIPALILRLPQPEAALALQLMSGAGLTARTPIEGEELEPGERPTMETKPETSPEAWTEWWNNAQNHLAHDCITGGVPNTPESLWRNLHDPERSHIERYWWFEQLTLRDGLAWEAEPDLYHSHLSRIAEPF